MRDIINSGATTILVPHSLDQIREKCNKVLWLNKGKQMGFGETNYFTIKTFPFSVVLTRTEFAENPLIALYFACTGNENINGEVLQFDIFEAKFIGWKRSNVIA